MSQNLEEIRKEIDKLDSNIHDLLMERADLIAGVAEAKRKSKSPVMQPAREAKMIRKLLSRHKGPLPEAAIVGIWRELVGAVYLLQAGLSVVVSAQEGEEYCWDSAKDYFGSVLQMKRTATALLAVSQLREGHNFIAVLPWPHDGEETPWWPLLLNQDQDIPMRIVCALPYGTEDKGISALQNKSLIVAKTDFASSGEDRSFLILRTNDSISRTRIVESLKDARLEPIGISAHVQEGESLYLIEVDGYVSPDDKRLEVIAEKFDNEGISCSCVGGYPVPPVFKPSILNRSA